MYCLAQKLLELLFSVQLGHHSGLFSVFCVEPLLLELN